MLRIVGLAAGAAALVGPGAQTARAPALQAKNVLFGDESRAQLVAGINAVADALRSQYNNKPVRQLVVVRGHESGVERAVRRHVNKARRL